MPMWKKSRKKRIRESLIEHKGSGRSEQDAGNDQDRLRIAVGLRTGQSRGVLYPGSLYLVQTSGIQKVCWEDLKNDAAANDSKIAESFRQIEDKEEFFTISEKNAQKQKEIGLWLITEPVDATTKKGRIAGGWHCLCPMRRRYFMP